MGVRRTILTSATGAVLIAVGAGGALVLRSPAETVAVEVPRTVLTATVEQRVVQTEVTGTGTVTAARAAEVRVAPPDGMSAVVTATPVAVGAPVPWCRAVVEVSGRPVLALRGDVPAYRDLTVGDTGADVRQLQGALRDCGYRLSVDGTFGPGTEAAITALYRDAGYPPVTVATDGLGPAGGGAVTDLPGGAEQVVRAVLPAVDGDAQPVPDLDGPEVEDDAEPEGAGIDAADGRGVRTARVVPEPAPTPSGPPRVVLPRAEVLAFPDAGRVTAVAAVGSTADVGPVVRVATSGDTLIVPLSATQRAQVAEGLVLDVEGDGWATSAPLPALSDDVTTDAGGKPVYQVLVPLGTAVPPGATGQEASFRVVVGQAEAYDRVVPVSALHQDTDGSTAVRVVRGDDVVGVRVRVVASAGGYSAVEPSGGGELAAGDEVVIGE